MAQKGCFCVRNGSLTPREEGFAKQTHVMLLGGWCAEDVAYAKATSVAKAMPNVANEKRSCKMATMNGKNNFLLCINIDNKLKCYGLAMISALRPYII
jgi:hypothetical protein